MLAGASVLLPGLGHFYSGSRRKAGLLFLFDAILLSVFVVSVLWYRLEVVKLWVSPEALMVIMAFNLGALIFRSVVALDSYADVGTDGVGGRPHALGAILIGALLVVPHALIGFLAYTQYDVVTTVFASPDPVAAAVTSTTTTTDVGPVVAPPNSFGSTTTTTLSATTTTTRPVLWDGLERLNVVLLGADAGQGRRGLRTDTTIVVSIDPSSGQIAMFSVPRDLSNAPLSEGMGLWDCNCFPDLITHLYDSAVKNPEAFSGPGEPTFNAIKGALGEIFGIPIHYYAMVTLNGFVGVVDALGGVTIEVPKTIVDDTYPHEDGSTQRVVIEAGNQELDGHLALAYARIRRQSDDFARMHRQRCVLEAVIEQTGPIEIIAGFGKLAAAAKEHVTTDIPQDRLVDFVDLIPKLDTSRISSLRITRGQYKTGGAPGRVYYDIDRIRVDAQELINDPEAAQARLGLDSLDSTCVESFD